MIKTPEDLRPGDIFLGPIGGLVGIGVGLGLLALGEGFRVGKLSIRHAAILTQAVRVTSMGNWVTGPRLAQAMPSGAEEITFDPAKHWTERCAWIRLPEDYSGQGEDAAAIARLMVEEGVGYSFLSYPALAAVKFGIKGGRLERWVVRRRPPIAVNPRLDLAHTPPGVSLPVRAICSRFVDQAWSLTGKKVLEDTRPGVATPGMLADQLWYRDGATWCRPIDFATPARSWVV